MSIDVRRGRLKQPEFIRAKQKAETAGRRGIPRSPCPHDGRKWTLPQQVSPGAPMSLTGPAALNTRSGIADSQRGLASAVCSSRIRRLNALDYFNG